MHRQRIVSGRTERANNRKAMRTSRAECQLILTSVLLISKKNKQQELKMESCSVCLKQSFNLKI